VCTLFFLSIEHAFKNNYIELNEKERSTIKKVLQALKTKSAKPFFPFTVCTYKLTSYTKFFLYVFTCCSDSLITRGFIVMIS
jgi:hypothetical protein